jgi:fermentation-respiration switch protein FrsA (DUF1100 family)
MHDALARRTLLRSAAAFGIAGVAGASAPHAAAATTDMPTPKGSPMRLTTTWDNVFPQNERVQHRKLQFRNRYGIRLAADLYEPKAPSTAKLPALAVSGPFGAVKEQSSGLYAQTLAERGFVALAFDPSFTGESGGEVRNVASPDIFTEDFSTAVDALGLLPQVDRERIGAMAICGLSGMALTAASADSRIKAVATASMYDMSRSISRGYRDGYTDAQRRQVIDHVSRQRWVDAEAGHFAPGLHEVPFDEHGRLVTADRVLPQTLPADANPVLAAFFHYYRTPRGFHARSINSTTAWTATTPMAFFEFPMAAHVEMIAPRPVLLIAGANAHSRYYSEDIYRAAAEPKRLLVVPDADHVDLYDRLDKIPFTDIERFFKDALR